MRSTRIITNPAKDFGREFYLVGARAMGMMEPIRKALKLQKDLEHLRLLRTIEWATDRSLREHAAWMKWRRKRMVLNLLKALAGMGGAAAVGATGAHLIKHRKKKKQ